MIFIDSTDAHIAFLQFLKLSAVTETWLASADAFKRSRYDDLVEERGFWRFRGAVIGVVVCSEVFHG